jgi:hypothetical protein
LIVRAVEVGGDFHGAGAWIIAGDAGGISNHRLKCTPEPVAPDVPDLAAGMVVPSGSGRVELINDAGRSLGLTVHAQYKPPPPTQEVKFSGLCCLQISSVS